MLTTNSFQNLRAHFRRSRWLLWVAVGLTLATLAGSVAVGTWRLRSQVRSEVLSRDAELLHGLVQMVQVSQEASKQLGSRIEELPDQFAIAMQISQLNQLNGVIATRLFDTNGQFALSFPANVMEAALAEESLASLRALKTVSRVEMDGRLSTVFLPGTGDRSSGEATPLLEIFVPFHRPDGAEFLGAVQFILDGREIATQFATLDRSLVTQAAIVFGAGAVVVVLALGWAFRRLQRANQLLLERTERLQRANVELTLAAKISAVGAIASHLVHGLSNPLAGLEEIVAAREREGQDTEDWRDAAESARRLKEIIADVMRMLGEEHAVERYQLTMSELAETAAGKVRPLAVAAGVRLEVAVASDAQVANREANLTLLILDNLLRNAIQATPRGRAVRLNVRAEAEAVRFEVNDEGAGVSAEVSARLFIPQASAKRGGHGVGLAISRHLAAHMEATLELAATGGTGSSFVLRLPRHRVLSDSSLDRGPGAN